eukprot:226782-Prymnesium_polylepis.1
MQPLLAQPRRQRRIPPLFEAECGVSRLEKVVLLAPPLPLAKHGVDVVYQRILVSLPHRAVAGLHELRVVGRRPQPLEDRPRLGALAAEPLVVQEAGDGVKVGAGQKGDHAFVCSVGLAKRSAAREQARCRRSAED